MGNKETIYQLITLKNITTITLVDLKRLKYKNNTGKEYQLCQKG